MYQFDLKGAFRAFRGEDRRTLEERRTLSERRDMIRFEPEKEDRRNGRDRRKRVGWSDGASRW